MDGSDCSTSESVRPKDGDELATTQKQNSFEGTEVMSRKRQRYSPEFKAQLVLEALRHNISISELAQQYGVHQTMIFVWRRQAIEGLVEIFGRRQENRTVDPNEVKRLHAKIGELLVQRDNLTKNPRKL